MKKIELKRRSYMRPEIKVIEVDDDEQLICTSVIPSVPGSTEEDWEEEEEEDMGIIQQ